MIKITRLTDFNVRALRELLTEAELTQVTVGETVAPSTWTCRRHSS